MKKYILSMIVACSVMTACQKDDYLVQDAPNYHDIVVTASLDECDESRTQLVADGNSYKVFWSEGDELSVFTSSTAHAKFVLSQGAGQANADFRFKEGDISFGTESGSADFGPVGVYPYAIGTTVAKSGDDYLINTNIPAVQAYAHNSFGSQASPMVAVHPAFKFSFKNVASCLIMPLKGNGVIKYATLTSKAHKIAGAVAVTAEAANDWIPTLEVTEQGVSEITLSCGEGVTLSEEEATNFFFVLAPGTYEANDLVVTFYDAYGNYFETEITAENTFTRSKSRTFSARTFEITGTKEIDLYIRAEAAAYMTADRIIPSLNNVDIEAWAKNLKDKANTKELIEEAITYITLKNYRGAYDVLEGIPGFVRETKTFEAKGSHTLKVDYSGMGYLTSMLEEIEQINDIPSLLKYLQDFENIYEGSGAKNKLDERLGAFEDNIDQIVDAYIEQMVSNQQPELDEAEALAAYKETIKKQLNTTITGARVTLGALQLSGKGRDEQASLTAYITAAEALVAEIDNLNEISVIKAAVEALPVVEFDLTFKFFGKTYNYKETIKPVEWLAGAEDAYNKVINEQILQNEELIAAAKAAMKTAIGELRGQSIVESLEKAVAEPESDTAKFLTYLFNQEAFMNSVKESLRSVISEIEEEAKDNVDAENVEAKLAAINSSKTNAIIYARVDAGEVIKANFAALNEKNLNELHAGPWGMFQKILQWEKCIAAFEELKMMEVYNAMLDLSKIVENMIAFDKGAIYYEIEEIEDYKENLDWWVITPAEMVW